MSKGYAVRGKKNGEALCRTDAMREVYWWAWQAADDIDIFRVHADGTEERLPSYEEALAENERLRAAAEDVCCGFGDDGEPKGPLSLRISRLRVALAAKRVGAT